MGDNLASLVEKNNFDEVKRLLESGSSPDASNFYVR